VSAADVLASYPAAAGRSVAKEIAFLDHHCATFLSHCPFLVLSTAGAAGEPDLAPRGGEPGLLQMLDPHTVMLADRIGNNRLDNLRNIAMNPRVALLCFVPGVDETLRIYGRAELLPTADAPGPLVDPSKVRSVLVVHVDKAFLHCAKALMRSQLWDPEARVVRDRLPSAGEILRDHAGTTGPIESQEDMRRRYAADL